MADPGLHGKANQYAGCDWPMPKGFQYRPTSDESYASAEGAGDLRQRYVAESYCIVEGKRMQTDIYKALKDGLAAGEERTMATVPREYFEHAEDFHAISTFETLSPWAQASVLVLRLAHRLRDVEWELWSTKMALKREAELLIEANLKTNDTHVQRVSSGT